MFVYKLLVSSGTACLEWEGTEPKHGWPFVFKLLMMCWVLCVVCVENDRKEKDGNIWPKLYFNVKV